MLVEAQVVPQRDASPLYLPYFWKVWLVHDDETDEPVLIAYRKAA